MTSLQDAIKPYTDGDGLISNRPVNPGEERTSDNGVTHSARYLIIQSFLGQDIDTRALLSVFSCLDAKGYVHRAPTDEAPDAVDDYYGLISLLSVLGIKDPKITLPWKCCHPALLYMRGLQRGGIHGLIARFYPLLVGAGLSYLNTDVAVIITVLLMLAPALIIAFSNFNTDPSESSDRLLTWNLVVGTFHKSFLCRLGAYAWHIRQKRLFKGSDPEHTIFIEYYGVTHPFVEAYCKSGKEY